MAALGLAALAAIAAMTVAEVAAQTTTLRVFTGGQQRPDVMRQIADEYQKRNPNVKIEVEVGGATSEAQQQYLNTVLASRDAALDVILIDVIRPAQWAAAKWAEPLNAYLGAEKDAIMRRYLPAYADANTVAGQVIALPYFADAQFLYYRKDLLQKHGLQPPKSWEELIAHAKTVLAAENNSNLRGFATAGATIEGTVCTFLVPVWGAGGSLVDSGGKLNVDSPQARRSFKLWADMKAAGILPPNIAEIVTDRIRLDFQAGNLLFAMQWGYAWNRFQNDQDSQVKEKVGVVPLPGFADGSPATCIGGWQVAVSAFSKNKVEAVKLVRYLSSPEVSAMQAVKASHLPVFPEVYTAPEVVAANPWFAQAKDVVVTARARPVSPRYTEVSDIIRSNMNAFLAGTKSTDQAIGDMKSRLTPIFQ
jgi:multiple sugar transport system substrate-binding protein